MRNRYGSMTIKTKTTIFVVVAVGILTVLMATVQFRTSLSRVQQIEDDQAIEHSDRVVRQLQNWLADVGGTNTDLAWSDDSFAFVQDGNQDYRDSNLGAEAFAPIGIDLVAFTDEMGVVVHQAWFTDGGEVPVPDGLLALIGPGAPMGDFDESPLSTPRGIVEADDQLFLVSARALLPSDQTGQPAGVLLMAREVNQTFVWLLASLVNLDLTIESCANENCAGTTEPQISRTSESITTETVIPAFDGTRGLRVQTTASRNMYKESLASVQRVLIILLAVGIAAVVLTVAGLRQLVIDPLGRLGSTVANVARTNDPSFRAPVDRTDEIGELASGVNVMLARLENSQSQLIESKNRLEGASEAKSRFLARVSHELRTPLNGVLAYGQLLQLDHPDGESRESTDQIISAARHITTLVDEFLDIARIEAGAIPINIEAAHATGVAAEAVKLMQPLADAQGAEIRVIGAPDIVALADPVRLRQSILNLVSNAIKYGRGDEPITVTIRAAGNLTAIEVRDFGPGIPERQLPRIFVPFDRLDADGSDQQGSGVGLSVTKQLVELMDGSIEVESEVGAGTIFTIYLPSANEPSEKEPSGDDAGLPEMASHG